MRLFSEKSGVNVGGRTRVCKGNDDQCGRRGAHGGGTPSLRLGTISVEGESLVGILCLYGLSML